jgi:transposase
MQGFRSRADRQQTTLFPECLDDWVDESNSIRAIDVFVDVVELRDLGFDGVNPASTGRPAYPSMPLLLLEKIFRPPKAAFLESNKSPAAHQRQ